MPWWRSRGDLGSRGGGLGGGSRGARGRGSRLRCGLAPGGHGRLGGVADSVLAISGVSEVERKCQGGNPCLALVGPSAASSMGVVSFPKAPSRLLSSFGLLQVKTMILWIGPWRHSGAVPFLKAPSWRPLFVRYSFVSRDTSVMEEISDDLKQGSYCTFVVGLALVGVVWLSVCLLYPALGVCCVCGFE